MTEEEREFWVLAVKLLFKRIKEGKIDFAERRMPETMKALEAVAFDDKENPIFETITAPVRTMANMVFTLESEEIEKEMSEREKNNPVHEHLVKATEVTDEVLRECSGVEDFAELAFELYKETGCLLSTCASSFMSDKPGEMILKRDQAICAGLLVRITKFMIAVVQLLSIDSERFEVILALNRCILESAINLQFLLLKDEPRFYEEFVKVSLGPEKEQYDLLVRDIKERNGEELPIETRMLASIRHTFDLSGFKVEEIKPKHVQWAHGLRGRLKDMKQEDVYASLHRIPSHAIHGTWVDLLLHHLEHKEGGFAPKLTWGKVDEQSLGPICLYVLDRARGYLRIFFGEIPELKPLYERMDDLQERILKVVHSYEQWLDENG